MDPRREEVVPHGPADDAAAPSISPAPQTGIVPAGTPRMRQVHLDKRQRHRVLAGHCWVYRSELAKIDDGVADGDVVGVVDARGRAVGSGYYNARSQITVRLLTRTLDDLPADFWRQRLAAAIAYRQRVAPWPARRLVNSEADQLPGLTVDQYGDHLVVQANTLGIDRHLDAITSALIDELHPVSITARNDAAVRELEGLPREVRMLHGEAPGPITVAVGDVRLVCDLRDPHKTGLYLDQQASYRAVAAWVRPGMRVLDAFCHLGGFALHAARAGAAAVVAIDSAADSVAGARAAAVLNGLDGRIEVRQANAFDALKAMASAGECFDLIVLDPPTFTRNRDAVAGALRGYKEIHLRALHMLAPGGVLATFSCSHHVDAATFLGSLVDAAADAGALLRREQILAGSPDHPVLPAIPESEYLKGFVVTRIG